MKYRIFIPHYTKLIERKQKIIDQLNNEKIEKYIVFEKYDKEDIDENEFDFSEQKIRNTINKFIPERVIKQYLADGMNQAEKSIALKHKYIYKQFLDSQTTEEFLVVLEDDVIIVNKFKNSLDKLTSEIKFDCINFGAGTSSKLDIQNYSNINLNNSGNHPFSRGMEGYIFSAETVKKVYNYLKNNKICVPIDWEMSNIFNILSINCLTSNPYLCFQGSVLGIYKSSIREDREKY